MDPKTIVAAKRSLHKNATLEDYGIRPEQLDAQDAASSDTSSRKNSFRDSDYVKKDVRTEYGTAAGNRKAAAGTASGNSRTESGAAPGNGRTESGTASGSGSRTSSDGNGEKETATSGNASAGKAKTKKAGASKEKPSRGCLGCLGSIIKLAIPIFVFSLVVAGISHLMRTRNNSDSGNSTNLIGTIDPVTYTYTPSNGDSGSSGAGSSGTADSGEGENIFDFFTEDAEKTGEWKTSPWNVDEGEDTSGDKAGEDNPGNDTSTAGNNNVESADNKDVSVNGVEEIEDGSGMYYVVTGSFGTNAYAYAKELADLLKEDGIQTQIKMLEGRYVVVCGVFQNKAYAEEEVQSLKTEGIEARIVES